MLAGGFYKGIIYAAFCIPTKLPDLANLMEGKTTDFANPS